MLSAPGVSRVLLLEQTSLPIDLEVGTRLSDVRKITWERISWKESLRELPPGQDLVIPVASLDDRLAGRLFEWLRSRPNRAPLLAVIPERPGEEGVLQAASEAVDDFVLWPTKPSELRQRVARLLPCAVPASLATPDDIVAEMGLTNLVGRDSAFLAALAKIPHAARSDGAVLITGETGTGKELCARALHHLGRRRDYPFVPVDCGALPDHLLENELFGHARGAYTDAHADQKGLAALAEGGTLFLDEIDSLSASGQAKLLRFLQDRSYRPLGADRFAQANVRIVAASNQELETSVKERRFRADLFFRLAVFRFRMTPLRERKADIALLAPHLLGTLAAPGAPPKRLSPEALRRLETHDWPGNVRELLNVLERAAAFAEGAEIGPEHVVVGPSESAGPAGAEGFREARARALEDFESRYVESLLYKHHGNITQAARDAGKDRRAFGRLVKRLGVPKTGA